MRSYQFSVRGRAGAIALGIAVVAVGIVIIVSGIALLIGVAAIAFVVIGGAMLVRRLLGRTPTRPIRRTGAPGFDPNLEVFPPDAADPARQLGGKATPDNEAGGRRLP